jgi:hypothetical protein
LAVISKIIYTFAAEFELKYKYYQYSANEETINVRACRQLDGSGDGTDQREI